MLNSSLALTSAPASISSATDLQIQVKTIEYCVKLKKGGRGK